MGEGAKREGQSSGRIQEKILNLRPEFFTSIVTMLNDENTPVAEADALLNLIGNSTYTNSNIFVIIWFWVWLYCLFFACILLLLVYLNLFW